MSSNQSLMVLINNINKNIINIPNIKKNQKILITMSGGQDSICLFFIIIHLKKQWNWSLGIIYCNHLWQESSFYSGSLIIKIAYLFAIPVYYTISANKIFKENYGRYWRYDLFYRLSFFYQYQIINTGHTANDKIETILFQNIRGTSLKSFICLQNIKYFYSNNKFTKNKKINTCTVYNKNLLNVNIIKKTFYKNYLNKIISSYGKINTKMYKYSCIQIKKYICFNNILTQTRKNTLIFTPLNIQNIYLLGRPILLINRFDLKKLLVILNLPLYPDTSNQKKIFYRNKIRKILLPTLKFFFNPEIEKSFFQFSEITIMEQFVLNCIYKKLLYEFYVDNKKTYQLNNTFFYNMPLAIIRKLYNKFLKNFTNTKVRFISIQNAINSFGKNINIKPALYNTKPTNLQLLKRQNKYCKMITYFVNVYTIKLKINFQHNFKNLPSSAVNFWGVNQINNCLFSQKNNKKLKYKKINKFKINLKYHKNGLIIASHPPKSRSFVYSMKIDVLKNKKKTIQKIKTCKIQKITNQYKTKLNYWLLYINLNLENTNNIHILILNYKNKKLYFILNKTEEKKNEYHFLYKYWYIFKPANVLQLNNKNIEMLKTKKNKLKTQIIHFYTNRFSFKKCIKNNYINYIK